MRDTFNVPEVSCGHCKQTVEGALVPLEGVAGAVVDIEGKTVTVDYDDSLVSKDELVGAIHGAGYEVAS